MGCWLNLRSDMKNRTKTCFASLNAGKNLKSPIPSTKKSKNEPPKRPGEEIGIDFTGNLSGKHLNSSPFKLVDVDKNSLWPLAKICKNNNHDIVVTFLLEYIKLYNVPKLIKSDKGRTFFSKVYRKKLLQRTQHNPRLRYVKST